QRFGHAVVEAAAEIERPERLERQVIAVIDQHLPQYRDHARIMSFGKNAVGFAGEPFVPIAQQPDELETGKLAELECLYGRGAIGLDLVNPAVAAIPVVGRIDMVDALVVPVGDVQGAVRPNQRINGPKPGVVAEEKVAAEMGRET